MKGVILAAGKGTRLEPLTYSIPKEMIHVCGRPLIQHAVDMLKHGGVDNIIVIVGNNKGAVLDYLKDGKWTGIDVSYRFQTHLEGVAKAIYISKPLVEGETFVVTLGDEILEPKENFVKDLMKIHKANGSSCTMGLSPVADPKRYGVVKIDCNGRVVDMMEKPQKPEDLERLKTGDEYLGINGVYVFEPEIFKFIEQTKPGARDEYQITDSIKLMLESGRPCYAFVHRGIYRDVGTHEALIQTEKLLLNSHLYDKFAETPQH
jgi:UDP-N-acetylglucosamine diphosphorylase / glucose-1-phosphate thymidylyltransferase / UDP-N-acetylgalactosamine diphosphorylase / glucosamine-1-phosphate N-acetyltransferase / galactosamine-1-phosphate N-acetyltransferase